MGVLNIALSIYLIRDHGIIGVAYGTAIPNILYATWILRETCRELSVDASTWCKHTLGRTLPAAVLPALALYAILELHPPRDLTELILAGALSTGLFALLWVKFVYRGDPDLQLWSRSKRDGA